MPLNAILERASRLGEAVFLLIIATTIGCGLFAMAICPIAFLANVLVGFAAHVARGVSFLFWLATNYFSWILVLILLFIVLLLLSHINTSDWEVWEVFIPREKVPPPTLKELKAEVQRLEREDAERRWEGYLADLYATEFLITGRIVPEMEAKYQKWMGEHAVS